MGRNSVHDSEIAVHEAVTAAYGNVTVLRMDKPFVRVSSGIFPEKTMPAPRMTMRKIKDILRLKLQAGLSHAQAVAALGVSTGVVTKYLTLATAASKRSGNYIPHSSGNPPIKPQ